MKKIIPGVFLTFVLLTLFGDVRPAWSASSSNQETKKSGAFSYKRETKELIMIADTELASRRVNENYFPLGIKIANKRLDGFVVSRETLFLVDESGNAYSMPDILKLQKEYKQLAPDHKFKSQTGILGDDMLTSFSYFQKNSSNFFPQTQGAARIIDSVYIRTQGYMEDMVYFPMPPGGIKGKAMRLRLDIPELKTPFEMVFIVE